ncbi:MAG TPA: JAB domain-containing protein [Allosphingosinicella sp.]|nr:JAB domain-containing protein [Allosphingosinicella sp.]
MRIATQQDAASLLLPFFADAEEEKVVAIHLDAERQLLGITLEQVGGADAVVLPVAAIVGSALKLGAAALIVAHNHPSGDARPSDLDRDSTRRLADAARAVGIRVVDHLIFGGADVVGMAAMGLM